MSPTEDRGRDFLERPNDGARMLDLKGRQIRTVEDGHGATVMSAKGEKSGVIADSHIRRPSVIIPIDVVEVSREGGQNENLGAWRR